jgi:hypothetical protein
MNPRAELTPLSALVLLALAAILAAQFVLAVMRAHGEPISLKFISFESQTTPESSREPQVTQPLFPGQPKP